MPAIFLIILFLIVILPFFIQLLLPILIFAGVIYLVNRVFLHRSLKGREYTTLEDLLRKRRYGEEDNVGPYWEDSSEYTEEEPTVYRYEGQEVGNGEDPLDDNPVSVTDEEFFQKDHKVFDAQYKEEDSNSKEP